MYREMNYFNPFLYSGRRPLTNLSYTGPLPLNFPPMKINNIIVVCQYRQQMAGAVCFDTEVSRSVCSVSLVAITDGKSYVPCNFFFSFLSSLVVWLQRQQLQKMSISHPPTSKYLVHSSEVRLKMKSMGRDYCRILVTMKLKGRFI
jgi:hypothetical protein